MLDIFSAIDVKTAGGYFICLLFALICGIIAAITSSFRNKTSKSFVIALILLPVIVETVIVMVNGNVGTGVAVMGAFSLVRFRSVPGKARDIAAIFLAMTAGLTCATGYVAMAVIFTLIVGLITIVASLIFVKDHNAMELRITVPESLNFYGEFDDIFKKYTNSHRLMKVKTSNMGSLYKLFYKIDLKDKNKTKEFIDDLRCRNGNLEISINEQIEGIEEL
ncbi:MAG: DUF4956 domain-containing protein [Clostridia bacterium]|nr:DUF4956 domain-containing protein [Clostridia bacterium]